MLNLFSYNGNNVTFRNDKGLVFANATEMAKPFGKRTNDYLNLPSTAELLEAVTRRNGITQNQVVITVKGNYSDGRSQGTWLHEDLALDFAQWLSLDFKLWCNDKIKELLLNGYTSTSTTTLDQLLQRANLELQLKLEQREALDSEISKYKQVLGVVDTPLTTLKSHYKSSTLEFLDKNMPLWRLRGYVPVNDFRALYNTEVPFDERLGLKELFRALEDYCSANHLIFKKSLHHRIGNSIQRSHIFEEIN